MAHDNALRQPHRYHHRNETATTVAQEWQCHAGNRQDCQIHSDVDEGLEKDQRGYTQGDESAELVLGQVSNAHQAPDYKEQ